MSEIFTVELDLAKSVFRVHGADGAGRAVLRKKLRLGQVLEYFSQLPLCVVAMEACGGAYFWGREIGKLGYEVRLITPAYVKPFVKRQKNDAAGAEAICEAALRPTMRFVLVKSEETQGAAMVFHVRELLIRQRTQAINSLRGHLTEFGQTVPQGAANASKLIAVVEDPESGLSAEIFLKKYQFASCDVGFPTCKGNLCCFGIYRWACGGKSPETQEQSARFSPFQPTGS
jgi:transposase